MTSRCCAGGWERFVAGRVPCRGVTSAGPTSDDHRRHPARRSGWHCNPDDLACGSDSRLAATHPELRRPGSDHSCHTRSRGARLCCIPGAPRLNRKTVGSGRRQQSWPRYERAHPSRKKMLFVFLLVTLFVCFVCSFDESLVAGLRQTSRTRWPRQSTPTLPRSDSEWLLDPGLLRTIAAQQPELLS
jgi:hypothetical protein